MIPQTPGGGPSPWGRVRETFVTGAAIVLPVLVTLVVLQFVVGFLSGLLDPVVVVLRQSPFFVAGTPTYLTEIFALALLVLLFLLVGTAAQSEYGRGRIEPRFEAAMESIPGIGSVYSGVNDLSNMLLESDTESFREVKAIEYPGDGSYSIAFLTAERPEAFCDVTGEGELVTLFMPIAPNPMGGFLLFLPPERVYDVDLSVEEGVQAVLSTGVTLERPDLIERSGVPDEERAE